MRLPLLICLLLINGIAAWPLLAGQHEPHERIQQAARQHILAQFSGTAEEDMSIEPAALDRRLKLARCERPLETFSPTSANRGVRQTVGVRCKGKASWSLYVTVNIEVNKTILVAKRRLARNRSLSAGDFILEKRMVSGLHGGYIEDPKNAVGSVLKLALKRGAVISPSKLRRPPEVKRGSQVTILGRAGGIEVRMSGKALSDGAMGQRIKVQSSSSGRKVEATVIARGAVEVTL